MKRALTPVLILMLGCESSEDKREKALQEAMKENEKCISLRQADVANALSAAEQQDMVRICAVATRMIESALGEAGASSESATEKHPPVGWRYVQDEDQIRNGKRLAALVDSAEKLYFRPPYDGGSTVTLGIRKTPAFGSDVSLSIDRGQFICSSLNNDEVAVKFDGRPAEKFKCHEPSDGSSDRIFLTPFGKFLSNLRRSQRVVVEVGFFQEGISQVEFKTSNLKWEN